MLDISGVVQILVGLGASYWLMANEKNITIIRTLGPSGTILILGAILGGIGLKFQKLDNNLLVLGVIVLLSLASSLLNAKLQLLLKFARPALQSMTFSVLAAITSSLLGGIIFKNQLPEANIFSGMIAATFIGGGANLNAVGMAYHISGQNLVDVNTHEMIISGLYFLILLSLLFNFFYQVLNNNSIPSQTFIKTYRPFSFVSLFPLVLMPTLATISSWLIFSRIEELWIILCTSTLAILFASIPRLGEEFDYEKCSNFFSLLFCFFLGGMIDLKSAVINPGLIYFILFIMVMMLSINILLAKLFKADASLTLVSSTACILGPAFIAPLTQKIKREDLLSVGISVGILGNCLGTYLGLLVIFLLSSYS